jgi:hypothetical protein
MVTAIYVEAVTRKPTRHPRAPNRRDQSTMSSSTMSDAQYQELRSLARVLEADADGDKVLLLADGRIMKLFRVRHRISKAHFYPYSKRFASNVTLLQQLNIATVSDVSCFKLPSRQRTGVVYQPLAGETLRRLGVAGELSEARCADTGAFVAHLHALGILFRSVHLGNILNCEHGELGLIDVADLSRRPWSLRKSERLRNFQHLFRPPEDHEYLDTTHKRALIDRYLESCPEQLAQDSQFRAGIELGAQL